MRQKTKQNQRCSVTANLPATDSGWNNKRFPKQVQRWKMQEQQEQKK